MRRTDNPSRPTLRAALVALVALVGSAGLLASGCGGGGTDAGERPASAGQSVGGGPAVSAEARAEARKIFETRCTPCHGAQGKGDGAASKGLTPPPRDLTLKAWQESVTDEHVEKIILYGGAAVGKSPAMPPNPDLSSKPQVVEALREHVRGLAGE